LEELLGQEVALEQLFGAMSSIVPETFSGIDETPTCLVVDKHLNDRRQLKRVVEEAIAPYFSTKETYQLAHLLAIEIKVAICAGISNIDEELTMIFEEIKPVIKVSAQKQKVIRTICQTILSCSELK
jgi:hypothetical protein